MDPCCQGQLLHLKEAKQVTGRIGEKSLRLDGLPITVLKEPTKLCTARVLPVLLGQKNSSKNVCQTVAERQAEEMHRRGKDLFAQITDQPPATS